MCEYVMGPDGLYRCAWSRPYRGLRVCDVGACDVVCVYRGGVCGACLCCVYVTIWRLCMRVV